MNPRVEISRATPQDIENLVRMRMALLEEIGELRGASGATESAIREHFDEELPAERYVGMIAWVGREAIASGGLTFYRRPPFSGNRSGREAYLMGMYTVTPWRGQGVGRALLKELLDLAKARGAGRVWLHSEAAARSLYMREGFRPNDAHLELVWSRQPLAGDP